MRRGEMLRRLEGPEPWDILVVGGGATGLGTAVDAAARGYRTLLLEAADFARGTSSRSTKLVHGGVRYLAQGNLGLVRQALHERGLLLRNAPHLVHERAFLVPAHSWGSLLYYGLGLKAYDVMAGSLNLGPSRRVGRDEALRLAPTLVPDRLRGGIVYRDGQFDDARLAIALLRTFTADLGGVALNGVEVTDLIKGGGRIAGVRARDGETGREFDLRAGVVVNATGVEADTLRRRDEPGAEPLIAPSQGAHIVLDRSFLPGDCAVLVPRTDDGRVLFAIPWEGRVLVGTTDTPVASCPAEPRPFPEEVAFLLTHAARYLSRAPRAEDVLSTFAGLRPLVRSTPGRRTAALSRDHVLRVSDAGLVTIAGGKWTTYRRMGADAVTRAAEVAGLPPRPCRTEDLKLHGWQPRGEAPGEEPLEVYGSEAPEVRRLLAERPGWDEPLHPRLPYLLGEVAWAARHEFARTVEDVLARRTRALFFDARASREAAPRVAALLADELGRDGDWLADQVRRFDALAQGYLPPAGL